MLNKVTASVELITPEIAKEMLETSLGNRRIYNERPNCYAKEIKTGHWELNGETIVFDEDGHLKDGHTRLKAIISAEKPVEIVVVRGVRRTVSVFDRGKNRSVADNLKLAGYDDFISSGKNVAIANLAYSCICTETRCPTDSMIENFILKNESTLRVLSQFYTRGGAKNSAINLRNTSILTAFFFALKCGVSEETIVNFANVLQTGFYDSKHYTAAIVLRTDIMTNKINLGKGGHSRSSNVKKIEKAILDFSDGIPRSKTYSNHNKEKGTFSGNFNVCDLFV